jgi:hypothetical protein
MEVSAAQEAEWPALASFAVQAVVAGRSRAAAVWFRTDRGISGSIPVTDQTPVRFSDEDEPAHFLGRALALGEAAEPDR